MKNRLSADNVTEHAKTEPIKLKANMLLQHLTSLHTKCSCALRQTQSNEIATKTNPVKDISSPYKPTCFMGASHRRTARIFTSWHGGTHSEGCLRTESQNILISMSSCLNVWRCSRCESNLPEWHLKQPQKTQSFNPSTPIFTRLQLSNRWAHPHG